MTGPTDIMRESGRTNEGTPRRLSPLKLFLMFFKVGVIGFGGGSALIPVIEQEIVANSRAMDDTDYLKHTVVANITPGALPVKLGATCGYQLGGAPGALAGAYGAMLPGVIATVLIMALFPLMGGQMITLFQYASVGISVFIVMLLVNYTLKTCGKDRLNWCLCIVGFLLTCGKEIRQLSAQLFGAGFFAQSAALFDISTIDLMIVTILLIVLLSLNAKGWQMAMAGAWAAAYSLCRGKLLAPLLPDWTGKVLVVLYLCALAVMALRNRGKSSGGFSWKALADRGFLLAVALFLAAALLVGAFAVIRCGAEQVSFLGNIGLSTVTSFGGGEAYVSVADGFFVQGGYIPPDDYYTKLVPVANALPGPILVKIAAGVGFLAGVQAGGTGFEVAAACAALSVGVCCCVALLVLQMYQSIEHSPFIKNLKRYILPVICGMLLSTSCSMLYEASRITSEKGIPALLALPVMLLCLALVYRLHKRFPIPDIVLLLAMAAAGLAVLWVI